MSLVTTVIYTYSSSAGTKLTHSVIRAVDLSANDRISQFRPLCIQNAEIL